MSNFDAAELGAIFDQPGATDEATWPAGILAVADYVEAQTIERLSKAETQVNVLAEIALQLTRLADASNRPGMVITAEQALDAWPLRIYSENAIPFLEALGIAVEQEPKP